MSSRLAATGVALAGILLVVAQDALPRTPLYHTWQYALALAIAIVVALAYADGARRGADGAAGKRLIVAMAGALLVECAGLASGLLGPDTATIVGTPGTVTPIPALGAAAFFGTVDAASLGRGEMPAVTLRRRNAPPLDVAPGRRALAGESLLYLEPRPAAFIDASDAAGRHLTVTQPTNASFLSPVLLLRERQKIGETTVPFDTFATPALHRVFRALYFTPRDLAGFAHRVDDPTRPALVLSAADDRGAPLGITLAASGSTVTIAGVRIRATLGSYPALAVAAAPATWALVAGSLLFLAGVVWSAIPSRPPALGRAEPYAI